MKTILLVEDNPISSKLIVKFIEINNYQAITASSAEEAFEILSNIKPDLILMDIMLPGMDGISAVRILKDNPQYIDIPVIALSAYFTEADKKEAYDAGCVDYIVKPINLKDFSAKLKKYLEN